MAYYLVANAETVMKTLYSKISILASIFSMLDEYKKIVLLMYLSEYICLKCRRDEFIRDDKYYIDHNDVVNSYEPNMRGTVGIVLRARDLTCHGPGTLEQLKLWRLSWDSGNVKRLLEYEGFM